MEGTNLLVKETTIPTTPRLFPTLEEEGPLIPLAQEVEWFQQVPTAPQALQERITTLLTTPFTAETRAIIEDERYLPLFFTTSLASGPDLLDRSLTLLNVPVYVAYRDPLASLLSSLATVLLRVGKEDCPNLPAVIPVKGSIVPTQVYPRTSNFPLERPPELGAPSQLQEDALALFPEVLELFFSNGRKYLDVLLKHGLSVNRLQDLSPEEEAQYLALPLNLFRFGRHSRIRRYALYWVGQLFGLGIDPYHDLVFEAFHQILRDGSSKVLSDVPYRVESATINFNKAVEFLLLLAQSGWDFNYQSMKVYLFQRELGAVSRESEELVQLVSVNYTRVSFLALCSIYNRADVMAWLFNYCGPLPLDDLEQEEDLLARRDLDTESPVLLIPNDLLYQEQKFSTVVVKLGHPEKKYPREMMKDQVQEPAQDLTCSELALRHNSIESYRLLEDYRAYLSKEWTRPDPFSQDVRMLGYLEPSNFIDGFPTLPSLPS